MGIEQSHDDIGYGIKRWFYGKTQDEKYFDPHQFFMTILYLIISLILTMIFYENVAFLNQYTVIFIRLGSILLLVGIFYNIKYAHYLLKQSKNKHNNLIKGHKAIIAVLIILALLIVYANSGILTSKIKNTTESVQWSDFNPLVTSQLINDTNIVTPEGNSINKDINPLRNLIPQPWSFIIFWGAMIILTLVILNTFIFHGQFPGWLTVILLIMMVVIVFQYKIPYNTVQIPGTVAGCNENDQVVIGNNFFGLGKLQVALSCAEYRSSQCRPTCMDKVPVCQCEANIIDLVFHQPGDWIFDGFPH